MPALWLASVLRPQRRDRTVVRRLAEPDRLHPAIAGDNTEPEMQAATARTARGGPLILIPDYQMEPPKAGPTPPGSVWRAD